MQSKNINILYIVQFSDMSEAAVAQLVCIKFGIRIVGHLRVIINRRLLVQFVSKAETDINLSNKTSKK